jgi:hypothetical protein
VGNQHDQRHSDANLNDNVPLDAAGNVSLRAAVEQANQNGPVNNYAFTFDPVAFAGQKTITLNSALPAIAVNVTLAGTGLGNLTIVGGGTSGIFSFTNLSNSRVSDLTIRDGLNNANAGVGGLGGGIDNRGVLTLERVKVTNCKASEEGGGIFSTGILTLNQCYIHLNETTNAAVGFGGGLAVASDAQTTINGTEIAHNKSVSRGGGISLRNTASVTVRFESTIWDNRADHGGGVYNSGGTFDMASGAIRENQATAGNGGGLHSGGTSTLTGVTVESNTASQKGGGVYGAGGVNSVTLQSCTFNNNAAPTGPKAAESAAGIILVLGCTGIVQADVVVA